MCVCVCVCMCVGVYLPYLQPMIIDIGRRIYCDNNKNKNKKEGNQQSKRIEKQKKRQTSRSQPCSRCHVDIVKGISLEIQESV